MNDAEFAKGKILFSSDLGGMIELEDGRRFKIDPLDKPQPDVDSDAADPTSDRDHTDCDSPHPTDQSQAEQPSE